MNFRAGRLINHQRMDLRRESEMEDYVSLIVTTAGYSNISRCAEKCGEDIEQDGESKGN